MPYDKEFVAYVESKKRYGTPLLSVIQQNI